jgi:hypothetical protein
MSRIVSILAGLVEVIDELPSYPFRPDVKKAADYLGHGGLVSEDVAALYLRDIVEGARSVPGFIYGADLDDAEAALQVYRPTLV